MKNQPADREYFPTLQDLQNAERLLMARARTIRKYYRALRALHATMTATRAAELARAWVNAGYLDIEFYDYEKERFAIVMPGIRRRVTYRRVRIA
ncbi:MAG: hypothetical protein ABSF90_10385 [Syntrophobacteraceae bacterium]|jgi:hypothetical protein